MAAEDKKTLTISSKTENIVMVESLINDICDKFKISEDYAAANRFEPLDLGSFMSRPMVLYVPAACRTSS